MFLYIFGFFSSISHSGLPSKKFHLREQSHPHPTPSKKRNINRVGVCFVPFFRNCYLNPFQDITSNIGGTGLFFQLNCSFFVVCIIMAVWLGRCPREISQLITKQKGPQFHAEEISLLHFHCKTESRCKSSFLLLPRQTLGRGSQKERDHLHVAVLTVSLPPCHIATFYSALLAILLRAEDRELCLGRY